MPENEYKFKILYEELDRLSRESETSPEVNELTEYEEIRALRQIVLEVQEAPQTYSTST